MFLVKFSVFFKRSPTPTKRWSNKLVEIFQVLVIYFLSLFLVAYYLIFWLALIAHVMIWAFVQINITIMITVANSSWLVLLILPHPYLLCFSIFSIHFSILIAFGAHYLLDLSMLSLAHYNFWIVYVLPNCGSYVHYGNLSWWWPLNFY